MEEDLEINDPRVEFLAEYVLKTMKLRADRWLKMYAAEENKQLCLDFFDKVCAFYTRQLYRQVLLRARISYGNSVCPSVCPSRAGTGSRPGEIDTPGLHHMIAKSL